MPETKIAADMRTEFGKGAARRLRRDHKVPAVLYGHGTDPVHISLPGHELMLALRESNVLLTIDVDGDSRLALPKQVQRDPVKGFLEHVDLILVRRGEKVTVEVDIHHIGEPAPDTLLVVEANTIAIEAEATNIPNRIEVSVAGLHAGDQIHASDLPLPEGSVLAVEPDTLVINLTNAPTAEEVEADLGEAEGETPSELAAEFGDLVGGDSAES